MAGLHELLTRLGGFFARRSTARDPDLDDEMRFHIEMIEQDLRRRGVDPTTARRQARAQFGGTRQIAEAYGDQRSLPWLDTFAQDLRYGVRMLRRTPGFTVAALLTLALGIGANTAIFSVVNAVLLLPLPYASPERLVAFGDRDDAGLPSNVGFATWQDYRDRSRTFEAMAAIRSWNPTLVAGGEADRISAMRVSWNYFSMLGVRPALGRDFRPEDRRSSGGC